MAGIYGPGRIPRRETLLAGEPIEAPAEGYLNLFMSMTPRAWCWPPTSEPNCRGCTASAMGDPAVRGSIMNAWPSWQGTAAEFRGAPPRFARAAQPAEANRRVSNRRLLIELAVELDFRRSAKDCETSSKAESRKRKADKFLTRPRFPLSALSALDGPACRSTRSP